MKLVIVRWMNPGMLFEEGIAYRRNQGDEDIMDIVTATNYASSGYVRILGDAEIPTINVDAIDEDASFVSVSTGGCLDIFDAAADNDEEGDEWLS